MNIDEIVNQISSFAESFHIKALFIVGDYCRRMYAEPQKTIEQLEIVCEFENQVAEIVDVLGSEVFHVKPVYLSSTHTAFLRVDDVLLEFQTSSNYGYMHNEEVKTWMNTHVNDQTNLCNNIYGREFTLNALVYSPYNRNLYDITHHAIPDINSKKIVSLLSPELLIRYHPVSCFNALALALQHEYHIDDGLLSVIQNISLNKLYEYLSVIAITNQILRLLRINFEGAIKHLQKTKLCEVLKYPEVIAEIKRKNNH